MVLGVKVFSANEDIGTLFDVVDQKCLILEDNWKRLVDFTSSNLGISKKTAEMVCYSSASWIADLKSIRRRLLMSNKTHAIYLLLSREFEEAYRSFVQLLFFDDFADFIVSEECARL